MNVVEFPRCLTPGDSRKAFGACAYIRWKIDNGKFESIFIAANSGVAQLKELTIPPLELQSIVLTSRLGKSVLKESRLDRQ